MPALKATGCERIYRETSLQNGAGQEMCLSTKCVLMHFPSNRFAGYSDWRLPTVAEWHPVIGLEWEKSEQFFWTATRRKSVVPGWMRRSKNQTAWAAIWPFNNRLWRDGGVFRDACAPTRVNRSTSSVQ